MKIPQQSRNLLKLLLTASLFTCSLIYAFDAHGQCFSATNSAQTAADGEYEVTTDSQIYNGPTGYYFVSVSSYWLHKTTATKDWSNRIDYVYSSASTPPLSGWNTSLTLSVCFPADSAVLSASLDTICYSLTTQLTSAARLSSGTNWYWYTGSCGGTLVDSGSTITIKPYENTTYYCRSESSSSSYVGACGNVSVVVTPNPGKPIISGCGGRNDTVTLSLDNADNATYWWGMGAAPQRWSPIGNAGFSSSVVSYLDMALDSNGFPYVGYQDAGNSHKMTVMKYNGSSWVSVGSPGISSGYTHYNGIEFDSNDTLYACFRENSTSQVTVKKFNGSSWVTVGSAGFTPSGTYANYVDFKIAPDGTLYVAFTTGTNNKAQVMKFNGTSWVAVGTVGFSIGQASHFHMTISENNVPYILFRDAQVSYNYAARVMKYNGSSWVSVGASNGLVASGNAYIMDLIIDQDDSLYVAYGNPSISNYLTVKKYNGTSWNTLGAANITTGFVRSTNLALDSAGDVYVGCYMTVGQSSIQKFDGTNWVQVGDPKFKATSSFNSSLAITSNGRPLFAYIDGDQSYKATVQQFVLGENTGRQYVATDTNLYYYVQATYANGCIIDADSVKAGEAIPSLLPDYKNRTYQSDTAIMDGNWVHYCMCDSGYRLLSLDTLGSGAVISQDSVWLRLGNNITQSWSTSGGMVTNTKGGAVIDRKWEVSPTTQPTGNVGVKFYFTENEFEALKDTLANHNGGASGYATTLTSARDMAFYKMTSAGKFNNPHNTGVTGTSLSHGNTPSTSIWKYSDNGFNHVGEFKVGSFSGGGAGAGASTAPLPVELIRFTAKALNANTAQLDWATASELNNSHIMIERSYDGASFESIGRKEGSGNSNTVINYNYTDRAIANGTRVVFYRLLQVDYNGDSVHSKIKRVDFDAALVDDNIIIYPNPFSGKVYVDLGEFDFQSDDASITVTDLNGRVVFETAIIKSSLVELNMSDLLSGAYLISVSKNGFVSRNKIIKN
ncbi:MAG: hypothetical protein ACJAQR_001014 [Bacteroidia bacterium]|jgi:hypothetical protein